ncbi:MAG: 3-hydroxyacyl-ACP dehydratase FabZ [SAR202 cluster bacterium]|nr:3-hydroxyacyl-ACP dehydratase FabZ [SAR202 cluster bacterium]
MKEFSLNSVELLDYQPNRYPFLMIDYVTKVKPGEFAEGYKNLSLNEWYFPKHFPGHPNMPGVLQLEALAQMLTVAITTLPGNKNKVTYAISHTIKLKKEVLPGEKLELKTQVLSWKRGICNGTGQGYTNGELACEATMIITIPDILEKFIPPKGS